MGDEPRSDLALAIAAAVFGPALLGSITAGGVVGAALGAAALFAVTGLVPLLLGRARGDLPDAVGLARGRGGDVAAGLGPAIPVALAGTVVMLAAGASAGAAALGRLTGSPLELLLVVAAALGSGLLVAFLAIRARAASLRSPVWSLRRLLRTVGAATAAVALVTGLLGVPFGASPIPVVANAVALVAAVVLADRLVGDGGAPRLAVLLPVGIVIWLHLSSSGFIAGLTGAALAGGATAVVATLALGPRGLRAAAPLLLAVHLWPTCLSPLAQVAGPC